MNSDPLHLDEPSGEFELDPDRRARMEQPLPVNLVTVDDARLPAVAGLEVQLDEFYVGLLGFERMKEEDGVVYRAENFYLRFEIIEKRPEREEMRALGIAVPSLVEMEKGLNEREIAYTRMRSLTPGADLLMLRDPAGNWLELVEWRMI